MFTQLGMVLIFFLKDVNKSHYMALYQTTVGIGVDIGKMVFPFTWKLLRMVKNYK